MPADSEPAAPHGTPGGAPGAPAIPLSLAHLPVLAGLAVPYITARRPSDGAWRFGAIDSDRQYQCLRHRLCQVCGRPVRDAMVESARFSPHPWPIRLLSCVSPRRYESRLGPGSRARSVAAARCRT